MDRSELSHDAYIGLKRSGKSCRLRWINYLHPGLKGGKMTPQEQLLVLQLHSKWGNRWSRIASNLPGRTDNEIKNYWRTHTRKKAQERKRATSSYSKSIQTETGYSMETDNISSGCSSSSNKNLIFSTDLTVAPTWEWDSLWNMDWEEINKTFTPHVIINPATNFCRL